MWNYSCMGSQQRRLTEAVRVSMDSLSGEERAELRRLARQAGMSVEQWVEYSLKAHLYRDAVSGMKKTELKIKNLTA